MDEKKLKDIAAQLACPSGEGGASMGEKMNDTNAFITERSIEMLSPRAGERIVEIGPGNGILSIPIIESIGTGGHYIGMELSAEMARQALNILRQEKVAQVDVQVGDCLAAPIEESSIDGLIAVNLVYFVDDIGALFKKISHWLKPGARAIFGVRSAQSLKGMPFTRYGFHIRSLEEITERLKASGFGEVDSRYFDEGTSKLGDLKIPVDSLIIKAVAE